MARKAWEDLSPAYRKRLESHGVTAESHRSGSLRLARGHGAHTRSAIRQRSATETRRLSNAVNKMRSGRKLSATDRAALQSKRILEYFEQRETKLGYVPGVEVRGWLDALGPERLNYVISWQEERHRAFQELDKLPPNSRAKRRQLGYYTTSNGKRHHHVGTFAQDFPTLEQYVRMAGGDEAWDSIFEDWWDSVSDLVQFSFYR